MLGPVVAASLRTFSRDRQALFFTFGFPIVMALILGFGMNSDIKPQKVVVVQEKPGDSITEGFMDLLEASKHFEISTAPTQRSALEKLTKTEAALALVIPDLSREGEISLLFDERSPQRLPRMTASINAAIQTYNLKLANAPQRLNLQVKGIRAERDIGGFDFILPTLIMLGVVFASMTGAATRMASFREQGAFKRLIVTPLQPQSFLLGELISRVLVSLPQVGLILAVGILYYEATITSGIVWIFVLGIAGTLIFTSFGVIVANYARSAEAASGIASALSALMLFVGGLFPEGILPQNLTEALELSPFALITDQMRTVVLDGVVPFRTDKQTFLLVVWLVVALGVASRTFKFKEPSRRAEKRKKRLAFHLRSN